MNNFHKVNKFRLWLLTSAIWLAAVSLYYWDDIRVRYSASIAAKAAQDDRAQESRFFDCLRQSSTSWTSLKAQYGEECRAQAREACSGAGVWCAGEFSEDICLKSKSSTCRHIYLTDGSADFDQSAWRRMKTREHIYFYWRSGFSEPLRNALVLMILIPLLIGVLPRVFRGMWLWLTNR